MKTMLKVTLLFALVAFANTLFATGNLKVNMLPINAEKAVVAISTLSNSNFSITIVDEENRIVYYQEATDQGAGYRKVYNFSDLDDGTYKLTVESNDLSSERQFQKSHGAIKVGEEKTTLEPFFGYEDGILRCSYLNFTKENMTLHFFENDELIYAKNFGRNFNVQQALDLTKLDKGSYVAILVAGEKQFSYPIQIQ